MYCSKAGLHRDHAKNWIGFFLILVSMFFLNGCGTPIGESEGRQSPPHSNVPEEGSKTAAKVPDVTWKFRVLDGTELEPFADAKTAAIVLVFVSVDCPIANAYLPHLQMLQSDFSPRGVQILLVHSSSDVDEMAAMEHAEKFDLTLPIVLDSDQLIARRVNAKVTPEAVVISRGSASPSYRGAIDNLYADYGKKRTVASKHYLTNALDELTAGEIISLPKTNPVGCFISFDE